MCVKNQCGHTRTHLLRISEENFSNISKVFKPCAICHSLLGGETCRSLAILPHLSVGAS